MTLARSVAHLSSEMRTQHLMIQEMEVIRNELTALRTQTNMLSIRSHSVPRALQSLTPEQTNSSPTKVKKLTKFFGDEPPLLRLFLKKLGYEVNDELIGFYRRSGFIFVKHFPVLGAHLDPSNGKNIFFTEFRPIDRDCNSFDS